MVRGLSIHIGLNRVDPVAYGGWDGTLGGCINDAVAMKQIADVIGYDSILIIDAEATSSRIVEELGRAAQQLVAGDILLLTYSGHGGQVPDVNQDEVDAHDETWVLYDRMFVDDELYALWSRFAPGVRIFLLSDSCHSGTVLKLLAMRDTSVRYKAIPSEIQGRIVEAQRLTYRTVQWLAGRSEKATIGASVVLISGCQDNQLSADGPGNGLFTSRLLEVWNNGRFSGNYRQFWQQIAQRMPTTQSPNYSTTGANSFVFESQQPFAIFETSNVGSGLSALPSVTGPEYWLRDSMPPRFIVKTGGAPYYVFEITSRPELFDITTHASERNTSNFYASWDDASVPYRLTEMHFELPMAAWQMLQSASRLYFRIGTTTSATAWDNYAVSTKDRDGANAPSIQITNAEATSPSEGESSEPVLPCSKIREAVAQLRLMLQEYDLAEVLAQGVLGPNGFLDQIVRTTLGVTPLAAKSLNVPGIRWCCQLGFNSGIEPTDVKNHRYGSTSTDNCGYVYTEKAGLLDIGHIRDHIDLTKYVYEAIRAGHSTIPCREGTAVLWQSPADPVKTAQAIAYIDSWSHELISFGGRQDFSAFAPEDLPSNFLGTYIGAQALAFEGIGTSFNAIVDTLLGGMLGALRAHSKADTDEVIASKKTKWWDYGLGMPPVELFRRNFESTPWFAKAEFDDPPAPSFIDASTLSSVLSSFDYTSSPLADGSIAKLADFPIITERMRGPFRSAGTDRP